MRWVQSLPIAESTELRLTFETLVFRRFRDIGASGSAGDVLYEFFVLPFEDFVDVGAAEPGGCGINLAARFPAPAIVVQQRGA
jgi:hypothetical protein